MDDRFSLYQAQLSPNMEKYFFLKNLAILIVRISRCLYHDWSSYQSLRKSTVYITAFSQENSENILLNYFKGMTQSLVCTEAATICDGFAGPDFCTSEPLETKEGLSSRYPIRSSSTCMNDRTNV